jgi:hypothetical protein
MESLLQSNNLEQQRQYFHEYHALFSSFKSENVYMESLLQSNNLSA